VIARSIMLVGVFAAAAIGVAWWWFVHCENACVAADHAAQDLFQRGELLSLLRLIDGVDARCRCARFTAGDPPPQYALAQACLRQLLGEGRSAEVEHLLTQTRGPILKDLSKGLGDYTPPST
jgi:hypothetical protein